MVYVHENMTLEDVTEKLCDYCPATWREFGQTFCEADFCPSEKSCIRHFEYTEIKEAYSDAAEIANEVIASIHREAGAA